MKVFKSPEGHTIYTDGETTIVEKPDRPATKGKPATAQCEIFTTGTSFLVEGSAFDVATDDFGHKPSAAEKKAAA
jgi:hypothetical protein